MEKKLYLNHLSQPKEGASQFSRQQHSVVALGEPIYNISLLIIYIQKTDCQTTKVLLFYKLTSVISFSVASFRVIEGLNHLL